MTKAEMIAAQKARKSRKEPKAETFHQSRANRARKSLEYYKSEELEESGKPDTETLRDFIQDAIHWLASRQNDDGTAYHSDPIVALKEAVRIATNDFPIELAEGDYTE